MRLVNGVGQVLFQLILITAGNLRDMASHCFNILIIPMYHNRVLLNPFYLKQMTDRARIMEQSVYNLLFLLKFIIAFCH